MRELIDKAVKDAMRAQDKRRLGTLRLITAAIKNRELGIGGPAPAGGKASEADVIELLGKMVKQRRESIKAYEDAGRRELASQEQDEIAIIEEFLPRQMSEAEVRDAVTTVAAELGATTVKDMGRVMGALKAKYAGRMDFGKASALVKAALSK